MDIEQILKTAETVKLKRALEAALMQSEMLYGQLSIYMSSEIVDKMREANLKEIENAILGE